MFIILFKGMTFEVVARGRAKAVLQAAYMATKLPEGSIPTPKFQHYMPDGAVYLVVIDGTTFPAIVVDVKKGKQS